MSAHFLIGAGPVTEVAADADGSPADWTESITGKLLESPDSLLRISSSPHVTAIVNGKAYKFTKLDPDGRFEITLDASVPSQATRGDGVVNHQKT